MTPLEYASALLAYCAATAGSVTSWGRTRAHNAAVGGVPDSAHCLWVGADIIYDTPLDAALRDKLAARVGLMIVHESDHDHIQPRVMT